MGKHSPSKINLLAAACALLSAILLMTCSKKESTVSAPAMLQVSNLQGQWQFTISPLSVHIDSTDTVKGRTLNDPLFTPTAAVSDQVFLHQDGNSILGYMGPFKITGTVQGDSVTFAVNEAPDGLVGSSPQVLTAAEMRLGVTSYGHLDGAGQILQDHDTVGVAGDTYRIYGTKVANIDKGGGSKSWQDDLCDWISRFDSFMISFLTGGVFRPMGNCYGYKSGGGYYVFGHVGPGSLIPVWTHTIYYPYEYSWCGVRKYKFNVRMGSQNFTISALSALLQSNDEFLRYIGLQQLAVSDSLLMDFYQRHGQFAISVAFGTETGNWALYVNSQYGDPSSHQMVRTIRTSLSRRGDVYVYTGRNIYDTWHLRRSPFLLCNTPLIICYLFGTNTVTYD